MIFVFFFRNLFSLPQWTFHMVRFIWVFYLAKTLFFGLVVINVRNLHHWLLCCLLFFCGFCGQVLEKRVWVECYLWCEMLAVVFPFGIIGKEQQSTNNNQHIKVKKVHKCGKVSVRFFSMLLVLTFVCVCALI